MSNAHGGVFDPATFAVAALCTLIALFLIKKVGFFRFVGILTTGAGLFWIATRAH